jgi:hypothetical protein
VIELHGLASYIKIRNVVDEEISRTIGRPAHAGHIAEFVAAAIFDIELMTNAAHKAIDGHFRSGPLAKKSVNIKYKSGNDGLLNTVQSVRLNDHPDFYLVLAGPRYGAISTKGMTVPWVIREVFLFEAVDLLRGSQEYPAIKPGTATSVRVARWNAGLIYPEQVNQRLVLSDDQRDALRLFWGVDTPSSAAS